MSKATKKKPAKAAKPTKEAKPSKADIKAKAVEAANKEGHALIKNAEMGRAMTRKVTDDMVIDGIQRVVGKNFVFNSTSLTLAKGADPSKDELIKIIGGFIGATEGFDRAKGSSSFGLGDACLLLKEKSPDTYENDIANIASEHGKEKFSVMQAVRVCEFWPPAERVEGVNFTLHAEAMNYHKEKNTGKIALQKGTLHKMLQETIREEGPAIQKNGSDKGEARKETIPVSEFRDRLREKRGMKDDSGPKPHTIVYVSEDSEAFQSEGVNKAKTKSGDFLVIDVTAMAVLKGDGSVFYQIPQLGKDVVLEEPEKAEPVKVEPEKKVEAKKEAPKADPPKAKKKVELPA